MLRIGPEEFCRHTPRQVELLIDAAIEQRDVDKQFQAALTANLMNCQLAKGSRVTADDLLGTSKPQRQRKAVKGFAEMGELERNAALNEVQERLKRRIEKKANGKQARTKT